MSDPTGVNVSPSDRDILRTVGKSWGWVLFFGIVTLGLGIVVTLHPKDTIYAFAVVVGIWLFVAGSSASSWPSPTARTPVANGG
jgi:uncharacterized membrane protein HdeD (DUF308 family)